MVPASPAGGEPNRRGPQLALGGYSKGMLQRIGLAQALVHRPKLVVLDEPTAGVDPAGAREIRDLILDLKRFAAYELSHCEGREREAYDRLSALHTAGESERLPTLIRLLKDLEIKLAIPPAQRIPDPVH